MFAPTGTSSRSNRSPVKETRQFTCRRVCAPPRHATHKANPFPLSIRSTESLATISARRLTTLRLSIRYYTETTIVPFIDRSIDRFANGSVYISNETRGRKISGFDSALIPRLLSRLVERKEEGRIVGGNFRDNRGKVDPGHRVVNTLFPCIKQTRDSPPLERPNPSLSLLEVSPLERIELKRETSVVHSR